VSKARSPSEHGADEAPPTRLHSTETFAQLCAVIPVKTGIQVLQNLPGPRLESTPYRDTGPGWRNRRIRQRSRPL